MTVRTRVAPSPTGDPHVGTAYMALFSLCHARRHGGQFVLRIEDTDQERSTPESEATIIESLRWLGLDWDEGPDVGGPHAPYRQSERAVVYREHADRLLDDGHAFRCFCTKDELDAMRSEQRARGETARYDGRCARLSAEEVTRRLDAGDAHVVRMKVPEDGVCVVQDGLRGPIEIAWSQVDMQVLLKADGLPTYHLAVVVDDYLMEITHIIRGEEWINSAPKHMLLFEYFGWPMPELIHMPLLRNPDKSKLSKRKNPTSINFYRRMGFVPEALVNYLGMLGWSMPDGEEKFCLTEMIDAFDASRISLGEPVFDVEKLKWLNGRWLREDVSDAVFAERLREWAFNEANLMPVVPLIKERVDVMSEVAPMVAYLFAGVPALNEADLTHKKLEPDDVKRLLQFALWRFEALRLWESEAIQATFRTLAEQLDLPIRDVLAPFFIAVSGSAVSPPLFDSMALLGPDLSRARIRAALDVLGGVSKKQAKKLDKAYAALGRD